MSRIYKNNWNRSVCIMTFLLVMVVGRDPVSAASWLSAPSVLAVNEEVTISGGDFKNEAVVVVITAPRGESSSMDFYPDDAGVLTFSVTLTEEGEYVVKAFSPLALDTPVASVVLVAAPI